MEIPPPPEFKVIEWAPKDTALLILDIQNQNCNAERRPRCVASVLKIKELLVRARKEEVAIVYSLTRNADISDIIEDVATVEGEPVVKSGGDKVFNTSLDEILRGKNIKKMIVVSTSAHGAVLHTATGASARGYKVIVPVDGISASSKYPEQYTAWHLVNAPGSRKQTSLTKSDLIHFS